MTRFSLFSIDLGELHDRIMRFEAVNHQKPYLIMAETTMNCIKASIPQTIRVKNDVFAAPRGTTPYLFGIPIAVCDVLPLGDIEIR